MDQHLALLKRAIELSEHGSQQGHGGPFGAVVAKDGEVISEGWNRVPADCDPTAHAEIVAIRAATKALDSFSLAGCVLYTSCEPCPMCLAASYWARVDHVYYANDRHDAAAIGFDDQFFYDELAAPIAKRSLPLTHLEVEGAREPMRKWADLADKTPY
ncbi:MAG: guanine deaminase [Myxococcota bacterium]|jgi:guanine deaminase